jgi:aminocarboxymuconate-semialdehyde decarboxylase
MTIVDFHNHYYPPAYLEAVERGPSNIRFERDDEGNPVLHYPGDYNVIVPGHRDIAFRQRVLDQTGVDMQILTFTTPGTQFESPEAAVPLSAIVNDALAEIVVERGHRFRALATLPMNNPDAAVAELRRAVDVLGFPGFMLLSNVNGVALSDERYLPLYEEANDRGVVFYIHPYYPVGVEAMTEYWLMPLIGFTYDTTLAAARIVFSGIAGRFPRIRWVLCHLGGAIPYLAERLDRGWEAFADCRVNIDRPPSTYLTEFFYDTVNFDPRALQLAVDFAGADHVLAGSDYPHKIGSLEKMISSVRELELSDAEHADIMGGNAKRLLGME